MGAPVGPTGCNAPHEAQNETVPTGYREIRGLQIAAGYSRFWSHLVFKDDTKPTLTEQSVNAQIGYFFSRKLSLTAVGGIILSGEMNHGGVDLNVGKGFVLSVQFAWQFLDENGARPFLELSLMASFSRASFDDEMRREGFIFGTDGRLGLTVGYTFFDFWRLYLSPRFFGGPVFIDYNGRDKIQGRDRYFFQAGLGMAFVLPKGVTIYVDGSPLGEQAISAGLAVFFPIAGESIPSQRASRIAGFREVSMLDSCDEID